MAIGVGWGEGSGVPIEVVRGGGRTGGGGGGAKRPGGGESSFVRVEDIDSVAFGK